MIPRLLQRLHAPRSLRKQLLATSLLILSGLLLLIGVLQYVLMRNFIYSNRAETMETQLRSVPRDFFYRLIYGDFTNPMNGNIGGMPGNSPSSQRNGEGGRPLLLDAHTTIAAYSADGTFTDLQKDTLSDSAAPRLTDDQYNELLTHTTEKATGSYRLITASDGSQHLAVFMDLGRPGGNKILLQMSVETGPLKDVILQQLMIFAALAVAALLAGLLLYLPALRKTLVPLSNMGEAAQRIDAGNLDVRFPVNQGQMEIDKLSHSFNGMLERLEISFRGEREAKEQMRRFAADASHELRTPLTSIHGFLEVLLRGAADNKEQLYNALNSMHGESRRINKLVEDLLLLARMDGAPQLRVKELRLAEIIEEMRPQLLVLAGSRRVTFDFSYGIRGSYDPDKIKQVVLNLFHNAVQHTDNEHGTIHIALHARGNDAELTVSDNGSGISAEHLPHVFDRFYRSDSSRTRKYGGSGLGLSITKSLAEAHGGEISAESVPGKGTTFRITLPCLAG
ncbi:MULTISPECIES: HAMP domain-containing sensor histidine kinase [unclassified Paenibacillus]|uniref:sensor histidine kinase n=1 Tax=unclassified Paenibacillus TaxID=185978 RepID=UPI0024061F2B|nr:MULTISPECIES: HAMP domain-containing sensor histidine kinase [unclassified Paenibacillus]MDF9843344.1 two-component system OmpR family sensor kinase [Paenibacillus sp. PastF-2]MDF9849932.1 two-component system OmpR family sensor kinase [Paenibacillus sp. PastM-2]MDF9856640.1 two-component system OmpR family sensor kinase [Paenibacillus sp. PastF-1]MDH6481909.1 two-component system OmpR family sensor kinase [Paenibacillus sp. PastH-2]MDH6509335.1 two-component system OmpR family sensor kinas